MLLLITITRRLLPFLIIVPFFFSCGKDPSDSGHVPVTPVDTLNAGWAKIVMTQSSLNDIFFINNNTGYVIADADIYKSVNGGSSWQKVHHSSGSLTNIAMGSESNSVFIIAPASKVLFSMNGGTSFDSTVVNDQLTDAFFVNATTAYAVGRSFWKSINAGSTWSKLYDFPSSTFDGYKSLYFIDEQNGWVAGKGGVFKTTTGGTTWGLITIGSSYDFHNTGNVYFTDLNNGYVTDAKRIGKTTNAGTSWTTVFTGGIDTYSDLHFPAINTGYMTNGNYIIKTNNGGASWAREIFSAEGVITEVHFTDANHGWACGTNGVLYKYQN